MNSKELGVVIPVWNRPQMLDRLLENLCVHEVGCIVVVDDGSIPLHAVQQQQSCERHGALYIYRDVSYCDKVRTRGDMTARGIGCHHIKTPYCMFLDTDHLLSDEFFKSIVLPEPSCILFPQVLHCECFDRGAYGRTDIPFHTTDTYLGKIDNIRNIIPLQIVSIHETELIRKHEWTDIARMGELDLALTWYHQGLTLYSIPAIVYHYGGICLCHLNCPCRKYLSNMPMDHFPVIEFLSEKWKQYPEVVDYLKRVRENL